MKKEFSDETVDLICEIASQYIDIMNIVKRICPRRFTKDDKMIIFVKTEQMFNQIMIRRDEFERESKQKKGNGTKKDSDKSYI